MARSTKVPQTLLRAGPCGGIEGPSARTFVLRRVACAEVPRTAVRICVVAGLPLVPVVNVVLVELRVVIPLSAFAIGNVVIVNDIHDHGDAALMAGADEVTEGFDRQFDLVAMLGS